MTVSYRDAAESLWGEAGIYAHESYARLRRELFPGLPAQLPIVLGLTAYGRCVGLTRAEWVHGPRISVFSPAFGEGRKYVDDILVHEMLHCHLYLGGREIAHDSDDWYEEVRRLSPAVLGCDLDVRRGPRRRSVRLPNPEWYPGSGLDKTIVRKQPVQAELTHADVARWPHPFREAGYYRDDAPMYCPTY